MVNNIKSSNDIKTGTRVPNSVKSSNKTTARTISEED